MDSTQLNLLFPELTLETIKETLKNIRQETQKTMTLLPGMEEVLIYLASLGAKNFIVSGGDGKRIAKSIQNAGIGRFFTRVFVSEGELLRDKSGQFNADCIRPARVMKPEPNAKDVILRSFRPKEVWVIGNDITEIEFAQNIGAKCIFLGQKLPRNKEGNPMQVDFHCKNAFKLFELITILPAFQPKNRNIQRPKRISQTKSKFELLLTDEYSNTREN